MADPYEVLIELVRKDPNLYDMRPKNTKIESTPEIHGMQLQRS